MGQSSSKLEDKSRNNDGNVACVSNARHSRSKESRQFEQHVNPYIIYRHGPTDPAAYSIRLEAGQSVNPMRKCPPLGPVMSCQVIGFAWTALGPDDEANMTALNRWANRKGELRLPAMCVKLRWQNDETSWEWQESAKRYLLGTKASLYLLAPESIEYNGIVLVPKNASIQRGDYEIIKSAVELEKEIDKHRGDGTHEHVSGVERLDNIAWMVLDDPKTAMHDDDTAVDLKAVLFDSDSSLVIWDRWGERSKRVPCGRTVGDALHKIHEIYTRAKAIYERTHAMDADCMDTSETDFERHGWYVDTLWFEGIRRTNNDPNVWNVEYGS